jgi:glycosyltransferase involved in cell wall biosynthesis
MEQHVKIVGASFGDPRKESTYSGLSKYLFSTIEKKAHLVTCLSTKQLRPWDIFSGAVDFSKTFKYGRPGLNLGWLWREKTVEKLSKRFSKQLKGVTDFDIILQTGTHIRVELDGVRHYCITDMTILQGVESKQFHLTKLKGPLAAEAIETQRSIFENCDAIFAVSNWVKKSIVADYGIKAEKVFITGLGASVSGDVDIEAKEPNSNILFVGRDWHRKGGSIALEAFKRINKSIPDAKFVIVGCSPKVSHPNVKVLGHLNKTDPGHLIMLTECFKRSTILCVPSLFDCFGFCFLEAQYYGVVPVTFNGEGREDSIKNNVTGILVEERNAEALSEAIIELLKDPNRVKEMSLAGYHYVREKFTWDHIAQKVLSVISSQQ